MGCQGEGVAKGGGEKFDKRNVVLELESLKAWVAKGGKNLIKGMLSGRVAKHGLPRGGENLIKGMLYLNLNNLETVQKPVGFFTLKSGRVTADP